MTIGNYLLASEHKCADISPLTPLSPLFVWLAGFAENFLQFYCKCVCLSPQEILETTFLRLNCKHFTIVHFIFSRYSLDLLKILFNLFLTPHFIGQQHSHWEKRELILRCNTLEKFNTLNKYLPLRTIAITKPTTFR